MSKKINKRNKRNKRKLRSNATARKLALALLLSGAIATTSFVGVDVPGSGNQSGQISALAATNDVTDNIDWDKVATAQNGSSFISNSNVSQNFVNKIAINGQWSTSSQTTQPNGNGYSILTTGQKSSIGYSTSKYRLDFSHDFTFHGNLYLGSNATDGGDGFNIIFSRENPQTDLKSGSSTGGLLGMDGLENAFGLAFDEHYNSDAMYGDFNNQPLPVVSGNPQGVVSWRTTDDNGNLNSNARIDNDLNPLDATSKDPNSQVVSMNPALMDGKAHAFTINYNASQSQLTITVADNNYGPNALKGLGTQALYKNTGATSTTTWTRTLNGTDKKNGLYLSYTGVTGADNVNNFGVDLQEYNFRSVDKAKAYAKTQISGLTYLTDAEKTKANDAVDAATSVDGVKSAYDDAVKQDNTNNHQLDDARTAAKTTIGNLKYLTTAQQTAFDNQVTAATTTDEINAVVKAAQAQNDLNKAAADNSLQAAKDAAKTAIGGLTYLSSTQQAAYDDAINKATDIPTIQNIVDQATAQNAIEKANKDKDDQAALDAAKASAVNAVDSLPYLSTTEKTTFKDQINAATDGTGVQTALTAAITANDKAKAALDDAKTKANSTINALANLDSTEKADFLSQVSAATTQAEIDSAVSNAQAQDALNKAAKDQSDSSLKAAKTAADTAIDKLPNLSDSEKTTFKDVVDKATDAAGVVAALSQAQAQDAINKANADSSAQALANAKAAAKDAIAALQHLSAAQKKDYDNQIDAVTKASDLPAIITKAKEADSNAAGELSDQKASAKKIIDGLSDLSTSEKADFDKKVDNSTSLDEINAVISAAEAQAALNAQNKNPSASNLDKAKTAAKDTISKLPYLTSDQKDSYTKAVTAATSASEIQTILDKAQAANDIAKANQDAADAQALATAKASAKQVIDNLTNLSDSQKKDFDGQVDQATTGDAIQKVIDAAVAKDNESASNLAAAKKTAIAELDKLSSLTSDQKKQATDDINAATNTDEINQALANAQAQDAINKAANDKSALQAAKDAATKAIDGLTSLTADQKTSYEDAVKSATDAAGVQAALDQAKAQNAINEANTDATAKALQAAKDAAKSAVDSMQNLTDAQKTAAEKTIDAAKTVNDVQTALDNAKTQDALNKAASDKTSAALQAAKDAAKQTVNNLSDLTSDQKSAANAKIDAAKTTDEINAALKDAEATNALAKAQKDKTELDNAKTAAKAAIDSMTSLTADQKSKYDSQVDSAQTVDDINTALTAARKQNETNQSALSTAKTDADKKIDALTNLSDSQRTDFKNKVDSATSTDQINQVVDSATAQDAIEKAKTDTSTSALNDAKTAAKTAIDSMTDLSQSQKDAFKKAVDSASSASDVQNVLNQATAQNDINKANSQSSSAQALQNAKDSAKQFVDGLSDLTDAQKSAYEKAIDSAKNVSDIQDAVSQAKAQNDINKASKDSSSSSALSDAKSSAKSAIDAMTDLTDSQKSAYEKAIDNAKTASDVQNVLNQAITQNTINKAKTDASKLADAKSESSKLIDELTNLTKDQQDAFKKAIDSATDASTIQSIVDQAKAQDAINKSTSDDTQTSLTNAKTAAKQAVDSMTNLTDQQKSDLKSKIDSATSTSEVQQLLDQAKTQDLINKAINDKTSSSLQDAKDQAKKLIDELTGLTQQEKDDLKKQIDDASSASDIQKTVDTATKTNDENQTNITKSKTTATKTITNLTDLTDEQRTEYINKIKNATTQDEIDQIIKDATAQSSINKSKNDSSSSSALDQAKSDTKDAIDSLSHLTQSEKDAFDKELSNAKTAEEIQQILDQAKAQDQINQSKSDTSSTTALKDAKTAAETSIDSMNNLTDQQKSDYKKAIDAAKDASTIESILNEAKAQDQINKSKSDTSDAQALTNAKTAATSAINSLVNLSQSQKDAFNKAVDAATSASQLEDIINQAKAQDAINQASKDSSNASDLTAAKTAASSAIDQLSNLTGAQKDAFKQAVQDAKTAASVQDALNSAFAQDALNKAQSDSKALAYAKQIAKNTIDGLSDLTDSQKSDFESQVDAASTAAGVQKAVNAAQAQNAANQIKDGSNDNALAEIKAIANATIDGLSNLNADQKQTWKDEVTKATTPADVGTVLKNAISANDNAKPADLTAAKKAATDTINGLKNLTSDQTAAYLKAVGAATSEDGITTIVNQATAQDAINAANKDSSKLQDAKDAADKAIDGMTNLSSDQKKQFKSDVDSAKDAAGVQTALDQAAAANKSTVTTDLTAAKKAATDKIAKMNLTDAQKTAFNKAVNAATDQAGIDSAISQAQAQAAINDANNDASKLADAKAAAKTAIDGMTNLSDAQKTQYKSDVDNAKDAAGVQKALDAAETANNSGSTTDLTAAKKTATDTINGLKNLTAAEDAAYLKAVDAANSQDSITTLVNQAKAQDALNAAVNDASKLADAKTAAKSAIDSMSNLIADKKTQYKSDVDKATTVAGVQTVLDAAAEANKSTVTPDLTAAKKTASDTINGLKNLTSDQTAAYLKAVDAANSQAGIDTAVAQAKAQDAVNAANNDASKLADAKTAAKSAIDGMTNLTADQKTTFKSDVDKATDAAGVQKALDAAETANNSGSTTDLTAAKKTATDKIAKMNLTDDQKTAYNKAVNAATDQAGIDTAVAQAQAQSDINDAAGDSGAAALKAVKAAAKDAINVFPYLTDAEKTAFNTQIDNAKDIDSVNTIVQNASDQNTKNASSQTGDALATAKTQAKNTIAKLANLTSDEQSSFTSAVDNATTTNEVQSIVSQAQAQDALNKAEKDNTAASLTAAKTSAKTAIDEMPYLTSTQASQYKSDVDSAKDATGVQTVLDKAKAQNDANKAASTATALAKAKTDAKATINALTNLSSAEKTSFTAAVDAATDIATVQQIVSQAQTQDANDKAQNDNSTAVKNAKTSAENAVDGLTNLSTQQKQDIKSQIEKATDVASIITLLKNAMDLDAQIAKNNAATTTPSTTTSSSSSSTTSSSSSSSSTPTSSTSTNTGTSSSSEKVGTAIYATKKIYLYKNPTFKKSERVATYGTKPRVNRPMFVITGTAKSSNGALRYKVRDVNHGSSTYGKTGYITARSSYVSSVYYAGLPSSKKVTIVSPKGVNAYKNASLTGSATHYKQGTVLRVKAIKTHNQTTRFELSNGKFITANKKFVMTGTHARASRVRVKRAIKLYRTANLTGAKRTIKAGKTLAVKGWTYSHATATKTHGTKRYIVSGGYITASSHYVKVTRTTR